MPVLSTFGAMSSRSFGFGSGIKLFEFDVLLVAGGGGGGSSGSGRSNGGGGAGGVLHGTLLLPVGTYTYSIGSGGATRPASSARADSGTDTTLTFGGVTYTALGGGGGGCAQDYNHPNSGANGGSGGGGASGGAGGSGTQANVTDEFGTLTGYGNDGDSAGGSTSVDSKAGGGGAGSDAIPGSHENKGSFPVQFGLGGDPISLSVNGTTYNVAGGGQTWTTASQWTNRGLRSISPSQTYSSSGSTDGYGDGGDNAASGSNGVVIIGGTTQSNIIKTSGTTFTINADGTIT